MLLFTITFYWKLYKLYIFIISKLDIGPSNRSANDIGINLWLLNEIGGLNLVTDIFMLRKPKMKVSKDETSRIEELMNKGINTYLI